MLGRAVVVGLLLSCAGPGPGPGPGAEIVFVPAPGTFTEPIEVALTARLPGAEIHYTTDGSLPFDGSPVATGPIAISRSTQVRAVAIGSDGARSQVVSGLYLQVAPDAAGFSSNLPLVVVHMLGASAPPNSSREYQRAGMLVLAPGEAPTRLTDPPATETRIGIKVRGRSTRFEAKHSFSVETWDVHDREDVPRPLLGMPAHADWVLYAPFTLDRTYMRNALIYALSNDLGRYAVRTRFVEVFLVEGSGPVTMESYRGVHMLAERISQDPARVAVGPVTAFELEDPDISGGYIVKVDERAPGEHGFSGAGLELAHVYPREEDILAAQQAYLGMYFDRVAAAAARPTLGEPGTGTAYPELIDVGSFIDHHLLNTLAMNPDALRLSAYFHKARGGRLAAGPVWDFDRTMGSYDGRDRDPEGWSARGDGTRMFEYPLWRDLFADPAFVDAYRTRFEQALGGPLRTSRIHAHIDRFAAELNEAAPRDAARWPEAAPRDGSYQNEVDDLKAWTAARVQWLQENLPTLPTP